MSLVTAFAMYAYSKSPNRRVKQTAKGQGELTISYLFEIFFVTLCDILQLLLKAYMTACIIQKF